MALCTQGVHPQLLFPLVSSDGVNYGDLASPSGSVILCPDATILWAWSGPFLQDNLALLPIRAIGRLVQ